MGLFTNKAKVHGAPEPVVSVIKSVSLAQSESSEGCKSFRLTTYGDDQVQANFAAIRQPDPLYGISKADPMGRSEADLKGVRIYRYAYPLEGAALDMKLEKRESTAYKGECISVYADGKRMGTVYDNGGGVYRELRELLVQDRIAGAHLIVEGGHFKTMEKPGSGRWKWSEDDEAVASRILLKIKE